MLVGILCVRGELWCPSTGAHKPPTGAHNPDWNSMVFGLVRGVGHRALDDRVASRGGWMLGFECGGVGGTQRFADTYIHRLSLWIVLWGEKKIDEKLRGLGATGFEIVFVLVHRDPAVDFEGCGFPRGRRLRCYNTRHQPGCSNTRRLSMSFFSHWIWRAWA